MRNVPCAACAHRAFTTVRYAYRISQRSPFDKRFPSSLGAKSPHARRPLSRTFPIRVRFAERGVRARFAKISSRTADWRDPTRIGARKRCYRVSAGGTCGASYISERRGRISKDSLEAKLPEPKEESRGKNKSMRAFSRSSVLSSFSLFFFLHASVYVPLPLPPSSMR